MAPSMQSMNNAFHSAHSDTKGESHDANLLLDSQSTWTRSPTLAMKRVANHEDVETFETTKTEVLSPSQRKRRRDDSDMSGSQSPMAYGSVRITSTSIRALVHDGSNSMTGTEERRSFVYEDNEFEARTSWAASSSRGSGRDSDLWDSPRMEGDQMLDDTGSDGSRPFIANASRNITFPMLQEHFSKPLKDAANHFGVCTTLLKKICRKNGISSWPYRHIIGLQKSISSMEQQVNYFDGEQRRQYADQLRKLQIKLDAFIRTGEAPSDEELAEALRKQEEVRLQPATTAPAHHVHPQSGYVPTPSSVYLPQPYMTHSTGQYYPQSSVMTTPVKLDAYDERLHHQNQNQNLSRYDYHAWPAQTQPPAYIQPHQVDVEQPHQQRTLPSIAYILNQQAEPRQEESASYQISPPQWRR